MKTTFSSSVLATGLAFLIASTSVVCSAGELADGFRQAQAMAGALAGFNSRSDDQILRDLAVMDLLVIAGLQVKSENPLVFDREDRRMLADHWKGFADVLIGGRFFRQGKNSDKELASAWDDRERATWNALDEHLDETHKQALRKAYPRIVDTLLIGVSGLRSTYLISYLIASNASSTIEKFGFYTTIFTLLRLRIRATVMPRRHLDAIDVTQSLIGLGRYLHVSPDEAFCQPNLVGTSRPRQ